MLPPSPADAAPLPRPAVPAWEGAKAV